MFFDLLAAVLCGGWGAERCPGDLMRSDAGRGLGLGNGERGACFVRYSIFDVQNIRYYRQECQLNERLDPRLDLRRKKKKINCHSLSFFVSRSCQNHTAALLLNVVSMLTSSLMPEQNVNMGEQDVNIGHSFVGSGEQIFRKRRQPFKLELFIYRCSSD